MIFADGSAFCTDGGTGLFNVGVFSSAVFVGSLTAALGFSGLLTEAVPLLLTLSGIFAGATGFFVSTEVGGMTVPILLSGFLGSFSEAAFAAGVSDGLTGIGDFSALLIDAEFLPPILSGVFAGASVFFVSTDAGGMAAAVLASGFWGAFSGMAFVAGCSGSLTAAPGFSALLTGAVSLPGVFADASGFFASAGADGDLTGASGFFTSPVGTVVLRLSLPDASAFPTSAGGGLTVPVLSSGFLVSAAEAGFMPSFLSGGFSVLGGAFGSFAASGFFSGAGCLLRVAFSSSIVFLLHRKMGIKNAPQVGTQKNNAQIYRPQSARTAAR